MNRRKTPFQHTPVDSWPAPDDSPTGRMVACIQYAQALGWTLGIQDGQQLRPATPDELVAASTAPATEGRKIVVLTGKASGMVAVELLHTHGCRLGVEDFPKTWTASSPIRSLMFFAVPTGQLPSWAQTCPQGVRVHADGSAVPLIGADGWQGFQWFAGLAPTETPLADLPRELAVVTPWPEPTALPPGVDADQMTFNDLSANGGRP